MASAKSGIYKGSNSRTSTILALGTCRGWEFSTELSRTAASPQVESAVTSVLSPSRFGLVRKTLLVQF